MNPKKENIIISPCLGIKIFTLSLVIFFSIPILFIIFIMIKYKDFSFIYFFVIILILSINRELILQMICTRFIIYDDSIEIVKRQTNITKIEIKSILGYKSSFISSIKGEYPDNLKIYYQDKEINFNKGLCSKKDIQKIYNFFEQHSINRI